MTGKISLTASMRSNLLSLQNISRQVTSTQNRLSTGKKVNTAIENPSSFYTARSLTNRAGDLDALLNSMGQAVSTIKAATKALESGTAFLEQAAAVATSALETNTIPAKEYFEEKVGANGAVVTTAEELDAAITASKEIICVYGKIDAAQSNIQLKSNQKLVGTEYYTGYTGKERFSQINAKIINLYDTSSISDISVNANAKSEYNYYPVSARGNNSIKNITINSTSELSKQGAFTAGIIAYGPGTLDLSGTIIINNHSNVKGTHGIYGYNNATINSTANIYTSDIWLQSSALNVNSGTLNLTNSSIYGLSLNSGASLFASAGAVINVSTQQSGAGAMRLNGNSSATIMGVLNLSNSKNSAGLNMRNSTIITMASAEININAPESVLISTASATPANFIIAAGTKFNLNDQSGSANLIAGNYMNLQFSTNASAADMAAASGMKTDAKGTHIDWNNWQPAQKAPEESKDTNNSEEYNKIITQYDSIIEDSGYKGTNLLKGDKLSVALSEKGNADLKVAGRDITGDKIGLSIADWQTQGDIAQSLIEISSALRSIRSLTSELGNNYSIITNRQSFTENLINILTEGADKLTLADMNEESANTLALQTRQQLATNALALASQANKAVLKLF